MSASSESWATSKTIRASMRANRSRDTKPELALRRAVYARGLRYRVAVRPLPDLRATADLVFRRARVAVFMDGCFWHGCPEHHRQPTQNGSYWSQKVSKNRERDARVDLALRSAGWEVVRIWEHEPSDNAAARVEQTVRARLEGDCAAN